MTKTKTLIRIDITSDTVCPWCFIGKKYLEKAMEQVKDKYDFEVKWHPFFLNPNAPKEGVPKLDFYKKKFGDARIAPILDRVSKVFADLGLKFSAGGKIGNTLDSHRLLELAGRQGLDVQNKLVEELFINYFTQEKYIGDKKVLVAAAEKAGVKGAKEFLDDPNAGLKEVHDEIKAYARGVTGVPHFMINGHYQLSGAQPPEQFIGAFDVALNQGEPEYDDFELP
ncbi:unnamed protein product [Calypogeia fissa]